MATCEVGDRYFRALGRIASGRRTSDLAPPCSGIVDGLPEGLLV